MYKQVDFYQVVIHTTCMNKYLVVSHKQNIFIEGFIYLFVFIFACSLYFLDCVW